MTPERPAPDVVKVGGSLLGWPGLPGRLAGYLAAREGERLVLVVGGGPTADWVRALDATHGLGEERSHHLAIRAMELSAHALAALMEGATRRLLVVEDVGDLAAVWRAGRTPILAPRRFLDADDTRPDALPHAWRVTSDSIAARLAVRLGGDRLTLLKSAPIPPGIDRAEAARRGLVDAEFPRVADPLRRVEMLNLRDPETRSATTVPA